MANLNDDKNYFLQVVWRRKYWIIGFLCLSLAVAYGVLRSPLCPILYESSTVLYIERSHINPQIFFDTPDLKAYVVQEYGREIPSPKDQFRTLTMKNYDRRIRCVVERNGNVLITVHDESPQRAYDISCTIVQVLMEKVHHFSKDLKVISPPQKAVRPIQTDYVKILVLVGVLTLLFSAVGFFLNDTFLAKRTKNK